MKTFILVLLTTLLFFGCMTAPKMERDVVVKLRPEMILSIQNTGLSTFSKNQTEEQYKKFFADELTKALALKRIIVSESAPEYIIVIDRLDLFESTAMDTVKDAESPDNKKVFELTTCSAKAEGGIASASSPAASSKWTGDHSRKEKFTGFRNLDQIVKGTNKDNNTYHEKAFDHNEFMVVVSRCAFSAAESITYKIKNNLKQ